MFARGSRERGAVPGEYRISNKEYPIAKDLDSLDSLLDIGYSNLLPAYCSPLPDKPVHADRTEGRGSGPVPVSLFPN